ncbi:MAG: Holliday junction resolvase RuvX [Pseudomonadales bacterium]
MALNKTQRRILAFDFGTHRIGVAFGQELTGTATPLAIIPARDGVPDWQTIAKLVEEWLPDAFVVGMPLNMDGSEGPITPRARKFGNRLHGRFHRPIHSMDERLSSVEAREKLHDSSIKNSIGLDSMAATLILESWFREQVPEERL